MGQVLLVVVVALTVAAVVFGVAVLVTGRDPGLAPAEPDGRAVPLPGARPLRESDVGEVRFDTALRGYRMAQVDQAMRRAAYDIGYKSELIGVLEAEVTALREGRVADADALRRARERAAGTDGPATPAPPAADATDPTVSPEPAVSEPTVSAVSEPVVSAEPAAAGRDAFTRPTTATGTAAEPAGAAAGTAAGDPPGGEGAPATGNGAGPAHRPPAEDVPGEPEGGRHGPVARSEPV